MSDRLGKPTCLIVASAAAAGVSAQSFLHCFTLTSSAFNLQVATPGGKSIDFVDVNESNMRWIQDFRMKSYANPAKLESIDGARYHALLIPNCPGAMTDLANSGYLAKILQHFSTENKPICAVGHGVAALCCATNEDKSWVFQGYSLTGPSVYELVRQPNFASLSIIVEDFVKDSGATFSASSPDAVHVVLDRHLVTGQNENSTLAAVQNLLILCNVRYQNLHLELHGNAISDAFSPSFWKYTDGRNTLPLDFCNTCLLPIWEQEYSRILVCAKISDARHYLHRNLRNSTA